MDLAGAGIYSHIYGNIYDPYIQLVECYYTEVFKEKYFLQVLEKETQRDMISCHKVI